MQENKRRLLGIVAAEAVMTLLPMPSHAAYPQIKALAFDAFPIFDPRPVFALCEKLYPGKGQALAGEWRIRQFEYQWLRALAGRYADFWRATEDALVFAARLLNLDLSADSRMQLMGAYLSLPLWPDVLPALTSLREAGIGLAFVSNATPAILNGGIRNAGLDGMFEHVLSTDSIQTYKPDPRAYQMAIDAFRLPREAIGFVAFAGWDAAGAKSFGYTTYWVNRLNLPGEELGFKADGTGLNLSGLLAFLRG